MWELSVVSELFIEKTMDQNKKVDFVRIRVSKQERERVERVMNITHQKRSEIYRAAIYLYIKTNHPEILD